MHVLVTGAGGFVGRVLVDHLERGQTHRVLPVHQGNLDRISERGFAADLFHGVDVVVHLANIAHRRAAVDVLQKVNVEGTRQLATLAAEHGVQRFIYVSSVKAMGEQTAAHPLREDQDPCPTTVYGRTKLVAEKAVADVSRATGLEFVALRPPLVYGPGVKANFLALMRAVASGWPLPFASILNSRSLIGVRNLAEAIAACVEAPEVICGRSYLLADDESPSTPELCRSLARALGRPARLFSFPSPLLKLLPGFSALTVSLRVDDRLFRSRVGWKPRFSLDEGLKDAARWYQSR